MFYPIRKTPDSSITNGKKIPRFQRGPANQAAVYVFPGKQIGGIATIHTAAV